MITLKDVAKKAGVSVMTVSRVVNGHHSKVSEETTAKILDIIKESGYVPNSSARSLSSKSSHIIAIIVKGDGSKFKDEYISVMIGNITRYIQIHEYYTMLHFITDYKDITRRLHAWNVEGAIFLGLFDKDILQIQEDNQIPLVFTDSYSPARQITNVGIDDYKGGVLAARHFIEKGHRSFAFIGYSIDFSGVVINRLKGFQDTIHNAGFSLNPEHILTYNSNVNLAEQILKFKEPVTAIFTSADVIAVQIMDEMKQLGLKIPEDYSIIGFDNLSLGYYATPRLTTITQDINRKAQIAIDLLFRHINDHSISSENIALDVQLLERDSVRTINP